MRLACAVVYVKNFPGMREFYRQMLRAEPVNTEWTETWALFDLEGAQLGLHAIPAGVYTGEETGVRESTPIKLIFRADSVPEERRRLESIGATMMQRSWQNPDVECDGADPEGNVFQISAR